MAEGPSHIQTLHEGEELVRRILDAVPGRRRPRRARRLDPQRESRGAAHPRDPLRRAPRSASSPTSIPRRSARTAPPSPPRSIPSRSCSRPARRPGRRRSACASRRASSRGRSSAPSPCSTPTARSHGAVVTFLDITERKRIEEERQRSEQKWRVLAENLPDFVLMTTCDGRILFINRVLAAVRRWRSCSERVRVRLHRPGRCSRSIAASSRRRSRRSADSRLETRGVGPERQDRLVRDAARPDRRGRHRSRASSSSRAT